MGEELGRRRCCNTDGVPNARFGAEAPLFECGRETDSVPWCWGMREVVLSKASIVKEVN